VHPHWVFETLAYAVAFRVYLYLRRGRGDVLDDSRRWWVIAAAAVGAVLGSKMLYWFEDPRLTLAHWNDPAALLGGKTIVGALIGGLLAVEWTKKRIGVSRRTGDLFAVPLCAGITGTMGGVVIDVQARAQKREGGVFEGLYAVGTPVAGLEGGPRAGYVGGLSKAFILGLLAAEAAAEASVLRQERTIA